MMTLLSLVQFLGDIRRWIISNGSISGSAEEICNKSPIKLRKGYNLKDVKKIMNENSIFVPIVDENKLLDFLTHMIYMET